MKIQIVLLALLALNNCFCANKDDFFLPRSFKWSDRTNEIIGDIEKENKKFDQTGDVKDLPTYDFVFVGSGSGGSTCAAGILKEQPNARILMLEAGSYDLNASIYDYTFGAYWGGSQYDYFDSTEFESGINRNIGVSNGFALGGSSSINFMYWIRGDPNDFNSWAKLTGDDSWKYENVLKYFKEIEQYREPGQTAYRGRKGDIVATKVFTESSESLSYQSTISSTLNLYNNPDINGQTPFGIGSGNLNAKPVGNNQGIRQDAFTTQLWKYLTRKNFAVLTSSYGDKVEFNTANDEVKFLIFQRNGKKYKVRATKDYIISAGALRTPLFLLRSGVGDRDYLTTQGIETRVNLRGVGRNLDHHPCTFSRWRFVDGAEPLNNVVSNAVVGLVDVFGTNLAKHQFIPYYIRARPVVSSSTFQIGYFQAHLRSRGYVQLRSTDPTDRPLYQLNTLTDPQDVADHLEGLNILQNIVAALQPNVLAERIFPDEGTDLLEHARNTLVIYHVCGTAKMGKTNDPDAVVDTKFRVIGVKNLRVVDASIMPHVTSFNTNCPTIMIGAKAAAQIVSDRY